MCQSWLVVLMALGLLLVCVRWHWLPPGFRNHQTTSPNQLHKWKYENTFSAHDVFIALPYSGLYSVTRIPWKWTQGRLYIGGSRGRWHTKFSKCNHVRNRRPPSGNPGSATVVNTNNFNKLETPLFSQIKYKNILLLLLVCIWWAYF